MNHQQIKDLIEKLIQLTTAQKLIWETYENSSLKLNDSDSFLKDYAISGMLSKDTFINSRSYIASYGDGLIGLLASTFLAISNNVVLAVQPNPQNRYRRIASTGAEDLELSAMLKRLYNLVDLSLYDNDDDVSGFIDSIMGIE